MVSALSSGILQIAAFYNQNNSDLTATMQRLASGKRMLSPSDDVSNYFRAQDLQAQADGWDPIISNINDWQGAMNVASTASSEISNSINRLNQLVTLSQQSTDGNQKDAYQTEFQQVTSNIDKIVKSTSYNSVSLLNNTAGTAQATLYLNPDTSLADTMTINLPVAVDANTVTALQAVNIGHNNPNYVTAATNVTNAKTMNDTFLSNVSAVTTSLNAFNNISSTIQTNTLSAVSNISNIDDASELATYTYESVQQQMSSAMLAQANMLSQSVLSLYSNLSKMQ
jgi:flagellin